MRFLALTLALLAPLPAAAQSRASDKLPPANALAYADDESAAVMAPVNALFAALAERDPAALLAQLRPDGGATVAIEGPNGQRAVSHRTWAQFAEHLKPGPEKFEERISDPAIEVDGDIAMVWAPYVFRIDGKVSHCGVDHFDLIRENGAWKIANISWTQRTTGCPAK